MDGAEVALLGAADAQRHGIAVDSPAPGALSRPVGRREHLRRPPAGARGPDRLGGDDAPRRGSCWRACACAIDVRLPVKMLGIAERQSIEIVRALSLDARVLVMDEPTSAISGREVDRLFEIVRAPASSRASRFCSSATSSTRSCGWATRSPSCARAGASSPRRPPELTPEQTVRHMIGTEPGAFFPKEEAEIGEPVLERAQAVRRRLRRGRRASTCAPARSWASSGWSAPAARRSPRCSSASPGRIAARSASTAARSDPRSPRDAMRLGISFLPEDRHQQGLVLQFPIRANETLPVLRRLSGRLGLVDRAGGGEGRRGLRRAHAGGRDRHRAADQHALRRQPAEGAAGQMADPVAAGPHPRSADARHRRRRQGGDPPHRLASGDRRGSPSS